MEYNGQQEPTSRKPSISEVLSKIANKLDEKEKKEETDKIQKEASKWKWPWKWKWRMKQAEKKSDTIAVFHLNIKNEIEEPIICPIFSGNMVIIKNKPHEVDPRAMWTLKIGSKQHKVLLIREMDRRPVSNLDWDEVKARGDATDSDEFLIKAALKAQTAYLPEGFNRTALIIGGLVILGLVLYFFFR